MQGKRTLLALAAAIASTAAAGSADATIVFDSGQNAPVTQGTTVSNVFGFLTGFAVSDDFLLTMIEHKQWQQNSANLKFVVFDNDTSLLLFESATSVVSPDGGTGAFADATYKSSGPISFMLEAGRNYMIGALTDGAALYFGETVVTTGAGIATLAANRNPIRFEPPLLPPPDEVFCCDNYVRLTL